MKGRGAAVVGYGCHRALGDPVLGGVLPRGRRGCCAPPWGWSPRASGWAGGLPSPAPGTCCGRTRRGPLSGTTTRTPPSDTCTVSSSSWPRTVGLTLDPSRAATLQLGWWRPHSAHRPQRERLHNGAAHPSSGSSFTATCMRSTRRRPSRPHDGASRLWTCPTTGSRRAAAGRTSCSRPERRALVELIHFTAGSCVPGNRAQDLKPGRGSGASQPPDCSQSEVGRRRGTRGSNYCGYYGHSVAVGVAPRRQCSGTS